MKKTLVCFRNTAPYMDFYLYLLLLAVVGAQAQRFKPWEQWSACSETCGVGAQERKRECANGRCVQRETRGCQDIPCPGQGNDTIPQFKKWTSWNRCSKTCGEGVQERTRECTNGKCIQKETQTCRIEVCSGDESFDWKEWSLCTATCGHGVQTRTRQCPVGHCQQKQTKTCYLEPCADTSGSPLTYESWEKWSECSKTCGPGKRSRIRQCIDAPCRETEVGSCMLKPCPGENNIVPGEWETWTTCSASCGYGQKKRRRTCIVGVCEQSQTQNCKIIDCPNDTKEYKEWEAWGPCSVTCGVGNQKRRRRCIVGLCEEVMTKTCFAEICPGETPDSLYQAWQQWSECTVSCGGGERRRKRSCKPPGNCVQTQSQTCSQQPCGSGELPQAKPGERFHNWEDWTPCSASCGIGVETRRRRCRVGNCVEVVERSCRLKSCFPDPVSEYESWTPWSECSATCGDGEAKRTRSFPDGSNVQEQLKHCKVKACKIEDPDKYDVWMQWSGCSVSCDTGIQTRVRFCKIGTCRDTETKPCTEEPCVPLDLNEKYGSWQSWGECTTTCGFGFTRRKRYCNIGVCEQTQSKTCRIMACPTDYTEWEDWSKCSVTCGSGISTRKRYCTVGTCEEKQQTTCDMEKCGPGWEDWSEWQGCHKSCGGGFDYRIRKCVEQLPSDKCPGDNYDYKRCNTHSCITGIWGPWSEWRECQVTCGTGETIRIRVCEEGQCEGKDRELKPCSTNECIKAQWSEWGDWGECSATCDEGTRTRVRTCVGGEQWSEGCLGSLIMKEACELTPCKKAQWSKWTKWRPCSVTCGKGTRNRERICINGVPGVEGCRGSASSSRSCSKPACKPVKWGDWTQWGECSVSCGGGITVRTRSCDNGKAGESGCIGEETETDTCNVDECVEDLVREWSQWSKWSECSTSCGIGTIFRQRDCVGGNNGCEGDDQEAEICIQDDCVAHWADWSFWTGCSSSCGLGLSLRIRKCEGGSLGDEGCQDGGQETKECTLQSCDEVTTPPTAEPAFWLDWSDWSPCPVTCDKGTQSRSRKCSRSGECVGYSEEARHCNTGECPTDAPVEGGKWTEWEKWGPCNVPCGSGISRRSRSCIDGEIGKGNCQGRRTQYRRCKKEDCEWSTWGDYGECSVTCGKGTQKRSRLCADGAMEITKCLGLSVEIAECTESECPFDPNVICPELPKPINAEVTSTSTAPYKIDAQLTYSCDVGYKLRGASTIRCQRDGRWSGPTPFCAAESCKRDLQRVDIGLTCHDACVTDLDCVGVLQKCECDGWCGKSCFDTEAECYPLPLPENGYIIGEVRTYGYTVTYGCNDGYILHGTATRKCRSDGAWTEREPQCYPYSTPGIAGDVGNIFGESVERVIKGNDAKVGAWPWQVLIMSNENDNFEESLNYLLAGGSVINERYILTAAHVLQKREESHWREHIIIVLGITLIPTTHISLPDHVQLYQPDSVITHEKFELKNFDFDVALISVGSRLKLQGETLEVDDQAPKRIIFSEFVRPIALPCISACDVSNKFTTDNGITIKAFNQSECLKYGRSLKSVTEDNVVVTGYGDKTRNTLTDQDLDVPDALQQAVLQLQRPERCIDGVKRIRQEYRSARFTSRMLCTSSDEGRDACQGDSGGPLVKQVTSRSGDTCWVQIGIISWGWGCANADKQNITYPGYYADVSSLMPWVVKNMGLGQ